MVMTEATSVLPVSSYARLSFSSRLSLICLTERSHLSRGSRTVERRAA